MHGAAEKGHDAVVKTLINHNADVNAVTVVSWCMESTYYITVCFIERTVSLASCC